MSQGAGTQASHLCRRHAAASLWGRGTRRQQATEGPARPYLFGLHRQRLHAEVDVLRGGAVGGRDHDGVLFAEKRQRHRRGHVGAVDWRRGEEPQTWPKPVPLNGNGAGCATGHDDGDGGKWRSSASSRRRMGKMTQPGGASELCRCTPGRKLAASHPLSALRGRESQHSLAFLVAHEAASWPWLDGTLASTSRPQWQLSGASWSCASSRAQSAPRACARPCCESASACHVRGMAGVNLGEGRLPCFRLRNLRTPKCWKESTLDLICRPRETARAVRPRQLRNANSRKLVKDDSRRTGPAISKISSCPAATVSRPAHGHAALVW